MAKVTLNHVRKSFDAAGKPAVADFSLEIGDKEFVVLVGPSGCGKSTTLRLIAGLEELTDGEIYIDDRLVNAVPPKERDIAMVFQTYALYPHMTVYENLAFSLKMKKAPKEEIDAKVKAAAELLEISDLLKRKPKSLSGGQRQRVAIGRAIVRHPKVFLMDEPLSNLDAKLRNQMRAELIKLRKSIQTTFIYVTHDQTEAMTLGDRIVVMKDGLIQQLGTPFEVFTRPANQFVAGFIGTPQMNFISGRIVSSGGRFAVNVLGAEFTLPDSLQERLRRMEPAKAEVTVGIRPEHLRIVPEDTQGCIGAELEVSELMGSEVYLHTVAGQSAILIRAPISDIEQDILKFGKNSLLHFTLPCPCIHLFDPDTQVNLLCQGGAPDKAPEQYASL
jgi:multiple sugar transport system ATP-binding protein